MVWLKNVRTITEISKMVLNVKCFVEMFNRIVEHSKTELTQRCGNLAISSSGSRIYHRGTNPKFCPRNFYFVCGGGRGMRTSATDIVTSLKHYVRFVAVLKFTSTEQNKIF